MTVTGRAVAGPAPAPARSPGSDALGSEAPGSEAPGSVATVALATAARLPAGMADTPGLVEALAACRMAAQVQAWNDPEVDWQQFALVIPHSTWDYLDRREDFLAWLRDRDQQGQLVNPLSLLERSLDKAYLFELAAHGIAIPPTVRLGRGEDARADRLWERFGPGPLVVKPAVGGGGHQVWRCSGPDEAAGTARDRLPGDGVLVQAFQPSVTEDGEYSAVFVDGRLSHVVRKRPGDGDFRVHRRYGATRETVEAQPWMAAYGRRVLAALGARPLYTRVDFLLPQPGRPSLMEVEVLEPDLYLREAGGAHTRFASALAGCARRRRGQR